MIHIVHATDDSGSSLEAHLDCESDTEAAGAALAAGLENGLNIYLVGDLGAGKTTLVRGALHALGHAGKVKSPTYTLIEPYTVSRLHLYHFDFYRFNAPEEFLEAGLDEYFPARGVCLVEWPDKAHPFLADPDLIVRLSVDGLGRRLAVSAVTEGGRQCTSKMALTLRAKPP